MEIYNYATYPSVEARAISYFLVTLGCVPEEKDQIEAYNFIKKLYEDIFSNPAACGFTPHADVHFEPWEKQVGREKDTQLIRTSIAKIEKMMECFFTVIVNGVVKKDYIECNKLLLTNANFKKLFKFLGLLTTEDQLARIKLNDSCIKGLKELADISLNNIIPITDGPLKEKPYFFFSHAVYELGTDWNIISYDKLLKADGLVIKLCKELEERGYQRVDCFDGKKVLLDYIKNTKDKVEPLKWSWADRNYLGVAFTYEELRLAPAFLWLRIPMFKDVLNRIGEVSHKVREFIKENTKTCDGCRYCVQTDKTGVRSLSNIKVDGTPKCPLYPGFSFNFRKIDQELFDNILDTLKEVEKILLG